MAIDYTQLYANQTMSAGTATPSSTSFGYAGIATAVAGAYTSVMQGKIQAESYKMQEALAKAKAQEAKSLAKMNNLKLLRQYNDVTESQMISAMGQGRSLASGSIQNILRAGQADLNWDMMYMEKSGEIGYIGAMAEAKGYSYAAGAAKQAGVQQGLLKIASAAMDYKRIK